ncbi:winged helix-turn-helix domain-containing protein [Maricaulis parjimensis]|uniref:winged helix-turn-helix domain-containing protein n=1 Tax=Maricaulis parjimensis TaxID=144023 RepID=UPI00193A77DB|nr:winged helix-turn-helix domain-containing protein [Maricaulis parjimensis]
MNETPETPADPARQGSLKSGDLRIDLNRRIVWRGGMPLDISDLSFDLLVALARQPGEAMDMHAMARQVWNQASVSEETIAQRVALLRKALGDGARQPRYIRTVRNSGYAWMPPVAEGPAIPLQGRMVKAFSLAGALAVVIAGAALILPRLDLFEAAEAPATATDTIDTSLPLQRARNLLELHRPADTDTAIDLLDGILATHPDHAGARLSLSFALTTRATKFSGQDDDVSRAEALARSLLAEDTGQGSAWHALAYALDARGQLDDALSAYTQAYTLDPRDAAALSSAAYLLRVRGRLHAALQLEARALEAGPPTLYGPLQIAVCLDLVEHPAAAAWWDRALTAGAGEAVVLAERMHTDMRQGRPANALERFQQAGPALQDTPRLQRLAGLAYWRLGDTDRARPWFERAGEAALPERAMLDASGSQADTLTQDWLDEALQDGASWPDLRIRLAEVEASAGHTQRAIELIGTAIDLGWRDVAWIETSPALLPVTASAAWPDLARRIERELAAQRRLIEADPALVSLIYAPN